LAEELHREVGTPEQIRDAMKAAIPWTNLGYVNFMGPPQKSRKGCIHVSFLSYNAEGFPGAGMYLADSIVLLESTKMSSLLSKTVEVRPRSTGQQLFCFGWEADGAIVNGAYIFVFTSLAAYALCHRKRIPQPMAQALGQTSTTYKTNLNNEQRLLSNLVESQAQKFANRPIHDPLFLANELGRCAFAPAQVKGFVKLYRQRTLANVALGMPQRVEDAVIKVMTHRISVGTQNIMINMIAKYGWDSGPWSLYLILADMFSTGAELTSSCHEAFQKVAVQSANGQELAMSIYQSLYDSDPNSPLSLEKWTSLCRASGFWVQCKTKLLPLLVFSETMIDTLDNDFKMSAAFRDACSSLMDKEPPSANGDDKMKDMATWIVNAIPNLKQSHAEAAAQRKAAGETLAGAILGKQEAVELIAVNFVARFRVDVSNYNTAAQALSEESTNLVSQWQLLQKNHVDDVKRFQSAMQGSDICFWQPATRKKLRANKEWLTVAAQAALEHKETLEKKHMV